MSSSFSLSLLFLPDPLHLRSKGEAPKALVSDASSCCILLWYLSVTLYCNVHHLSLCASHFKERIFSSILFYHVCVSLTPPWDNQWHDFKKAGEKWWGSDSRLNRRFLLSNKPSRLALFPSKRTRSSSHTHTKRLKTKPMNKPLGTLFMEMPSLRKRRGQPPTPHNPLPAPSSYAGFRVLRKNEKPNSPIPFASKTSS